MVETRIVPTSAGPVEIVHVPGERPPVLFFPGGHCAAGSDCGRGIYTESGHAVIAFSRPGYGRTQVGSMSAAEFAPLVGEVCEQIGVSVVAAAVGVSFGGMQAIHVASLRQLAVPRLALHSAAPSCLSYPDTRAETIGGSLLFSPLLQGLVWGLVHGLVSTDPGLRLFMGRLSKLPVDDWWQDTSDAERHAARSMFLSMRSDRGFVNDLRQGRKHASPARREALSSVPCPALVTGSRHDRGVSFVHAEDLATTIPGAVLMELDSPSHLFWIGPGRARLVSIVSAFLEA